MRADAWYTTGRDHLVAQDYALASADCPADGAARAWAIVCDGCSARPHSDLGARAVAHAARLELQRGVAPSPVAVAQRAAAALATLGLGPECLDTTCLSVRATDDTLVVDPCGDGLVARVTDDGRVQAWWIEYPAGTPAYLSYHHDPARARAWHDPGGDAWIVRHRDDAPHPWRTIAEGRGFVPAWSIPIAGTRFVLLSSDGIAAVTAEDRPVPPEDVLAELVRMGPAGGRCLTRRARRLVSRLADARGWRMHDDLGVAAVFADVPRVA
jgi:hypothetical protein